MIDSNSQFFATLTALGEAKQANATALGIPWTFKEMAVGDANGTDPVPNKRQTKLINEWRRAPVNQVRTDPANPNVIITEQVIPPDVGGHWIREIGLFDADGDLVAVANCAPTFKPLLAQGTGKTQIIRMNFIVSNTAQIVLKIDPSVVLATRQYVDDSLATALPANKAAGTYRQVTIDKRGVVLTGTNPTTVAGYGITDAYTKPETTAAIQQAVAALVASAPGTLDTLKELADALGNDPNFATTMTNALAAKANKATTLGGYGIVDGATKSDLDSAVSGLLPKAGGIVSGPIYLANGTGDSPEIAWKTPELEVYADVINRTLRFFSYFNGQTEFPLVIDVPGKSASFFGNTAWHSGNFKPPIQATESGLGIAKVATNAQVAALVDDQTIVTPLKLAPLANKVSSLEGRQIFSKHFVSTEQMITEGGTLTIQHNQGMPVLWESYLICKESEHGYWPGAVLNVTNAVPDNAYNLGVSVVPDANQLNCKFGTQIGVFFVLDWSTRTTKIITPSKWRVFFRVLA